MAYAGYLLKVGNYEIDGTYYIGYDKYSCTVNVQDLDSFRNADGVLVRNALDHYAVKLEFETRENLTNSDIATFFGNIRSNFTVAKERKATVTAYVPEFDTYVTQDMYMADPQFKIKKIEPVTNVIKYEPVRVAFIGY